MTDHGISAMLGREYEMATLQGCLAGAIAGDGQVVLLEAEAGFGKTRLLEELARRAEAAGAIVLRGRGVPGGGPYRPVAESLLGRLRDVRLDSAELRPFRGVLNRLLPGWGDAAVGAEPFLDPHVVMGEAVVRLFRLLAGDAGCAVLLDDLHWADPDTLALVDYLAAALPDSPVLVVAAARSDEPAEVELSGIRRHPRSRVLSLGPLDRPAVASLVAARLGGAAPAHVVDHIVDSAGGSPLIAEELTDGLVRSGALKRTSVGWTAPAAIAPFVPRTLAELVVERLSSLCLHDRKVLTTAAVIDASVRPDVISAAAGLTETVVFAGLRAGLRRHLLVSDSRTAAGVRWRHALTREAVLASLLPLERAAVARRAADVLATAGESEPGDAALAAALYEACGMHAQAAALNAGLGRAAARRGALATALERLDAAATLAGRDTTLQASVAAERIKVLAATGDIERALLEGETALRAAPPAQRAELALAIARACLAADRYAAAELALFHVDEGDPRRAALAAHIAFGQGEPGRAASLAGLVVAECDAHNAPDVLCDALEIIGRCERLRSLDGAEAAFSQAHDVAMSAGLTTARIRALSELGILQGLRRADPARLLEARQLAGDVGMLGTVAMLDLQVAACLSVRDGLAAAQSLAERAAANAERLGLKAVAASALVFVAGGLLAQGRRMDMRRALDRAAELDPQSVDVRAWTAGVNGMAALFDDDLPQSVSAFDEAVSSLRQSEVASSTSWWGLWVVTRTTADGRLPPPAPEWPLALVQKANCAALAYAQVVDAGVRGDLTLMRARLTDADRDSQPMPHWHHLMRLLLARAALGASWGQPVAWARESLTYFEGKEPPLAALARNVLRASGEPVPRRRGAVSAVPADLRKVGVTARELEVLTLLRENLTNSEIARRLFLSPRTVETHIKHLMQKVERSSRAGLSDLARSLP